MNISKKTFGRLSTGEKVEIYTLRAGEMTLSVSTLGATWTSLGVPSRMGGVDDILLGFSTLSGYTGSNPYMGSTIGRVGNRIAGGVFSIGEKTFNLYKNDGDHSLHGGYRGFDKKIWKAERYENGDGVFVRFEHDSPDGDESYPGNLHAVVSYGLTNANELTIDYSATVDTFSPINMTNHAYFNLAGEGKGDILSHELVLHSSSYLEVNQLLIPTGKLLPVNGTPFDFRTRKKVGKDIAGTGGGYDHCFVVEGKYGTLRPCAMVFEETSGRSMKIFSTQPGVQFYTGNFLAGLPGKFGSVYHKHAGFCLETQHYPDSPNQKTFPSAIFGPTRPYVEKAVFTFSW